MSLFSKTITQVPAFVSKFQAFDSFFIYKEVRIFFLIIDFLFIGSFFFCTNFYFYLLFDHSTWHVVS